MVCEINEKLSNTAIEAMCGHGNLAPCPIITTTAFQPWPKYCLSIMSVWAMEYDSLIAEAKDYTFQDSCQACFGPEPSKTEISLV